MDRERPDRPRADRFDRQARPRRPPLAAAVGRAGGRDAWGLKRNPRQRILQFADTAGPPAELAFDADANPDTYAFRDHIAYDEYDEQMPSRAGGRTSSAT